MQVYLSCTFENREYTNCDMAKPCQTWTLSPCFMQMEMPIHGDGEPQKNLVLFDCLSCAQPFHALAITLNSPAQDGP